VPDVPTHPQFTAVAPFYDILMANVPYARWVDYVEEILERRACRARTVLDLACGTGKAGFELARRGYDVVGADLSFPMVRQARRNRAAPGPPVRFVVQDACALGFRPHFDLAVCFYDSLNYVLDIDRLAKVFEGVWRALRPGGLLVFDMNTTYALRKNLFTQNNLKDRQAPLLYDWRSQYDRRAKIATVRMRFIWRSGDGREVREVHRQKAYEIEEVLAALARTQFTDADAYHALGFAPPGPKTSRVYYVARKPVGATPEDVP
jgi:SAM-dependent methyltransferase